jgi:8-oxo-dGTP pyrophosphatase MutT (NUDIX family)
MTCGIRAALASTASDPGPALGCYAPAVAGAGVRHVARVVVLDGRNATLLVRYEDAGASYWVPPGGALEPGEDHASAAARELHEETGLAMSVGPALCERRVRLHIRGVPVDQIERYFVARVPSVAPPVANNSAEDIAGHRWWPLQELRATADTIFPDGLADLVAAVLARPPPDPLNTT